MKEFPLRLEHYFFTHQEVTANAGFNQDVENNPIHIDYIVNSNATPLADQPNKYGVSVHVELNQESSHNPPYFFSITAFSIISVRDNSVGQAAIESMIGSSGMQLIVGAIRERLADLTARGPWGIAQQMDFIPLTIKLDS